MYHLNIQSFCTKQDLERILPGKFRGAFAAVIIVLMLSLNTAPAHAQSELATLTGTVADSSGGIIANADVIVMNQGTNIASVGRTDENGRYFVRSLKPGLYTVSVSAPGFKKYVNNALTLQVNQTARLDI